MRRRTLRRARRGNGDGDGDGDEFQDTWDRDRDRDRDRDGRRCSSRCALRWWSTSSVAVPMMTREGASFRGAMDGAATKEQSDD
jgi:hypothetical protein